MTTDAIQQRLDQLTAMVADLHRAQLRPPVVDKSEAMRLAGIGSSAAWHRWCKEHGVRKCSPRGYARHVIMRALEREAGLRRS